MTGRRFRPPPWRAVPAAAKEHGLLRPRHHLNGRGPGPKPSPFGLRLTEMEKAAPFPQPTGCSSVAGVRRWLFGGGSSVAGVLPASSHRLAPLRFHDSGPAASTPAPTPPTSGRSTPAPPPRGISLAALKPPGLPRPRHYLHGRSPKPCPCGSRLTEMELAAPYPRPTGYSGVLLRKAASRAESWLLATTSAGFVPLGGRSTPTTTPRVTSVAALRPPVYGPDAASLTYWTRLHSTPATPRVSHAGIVPGAAVPRLLRLQGLAVRHAFPTGGSFRLRMFTTLPPPVTEVDLMAAKKTWTFGKPSSFLIQRPTAAKVKESLQLDMEAFAQYQDKAVLVEKFKTLVQHALVCRCLLSPYPLGHPNMAQLHNQYKNIIGHYPRYMTSLELMENLESMTPSYRDLFLDHLSEDRAIIVEDWEKRLGASAGATVYELSISRSMRDDDDVIRGECDASFHKSFSTSPVGKAKLCSVIWYRNKVLSCIVVKDFECKSSVEAEATAMYILLKEGISLFLNEKPFKASTDSGLVYEILWGTHRIKHEEDSAELYRLLKFMCCYYKKLIPEHEPREKMSFVDGLMRMCKGDEANQIAALLRKRELDLSGHPIFKFTQKSGTTTKLANRTLPFSLEVERSCYAEVEEKNKIDVAYHVISAMRPWNVVIISRGLQSEQEKVFDLFEDCDVQVFQMDGHNILTFKVNHRTPFHKVSKKVLRVVLDDDLPVQEPNDENIFTVFLTRSNAVHLELPVLSPTSFVSFHQPPNRCSGMKEPEPKPVQPDGSSLSMPNDGEKDNGK